MSELSARHFPCPLREAVDVILGGPCQDLPLDDVALDHWVLVGVIIPGSHYGRPELGDLLGVISFHRVSLHSRPTFKITDEWPPSASALGTDVLATHSGHRLVCGHTHTRCSVEILRSSNVKRNVSISRVNAKAE